MPAKPPKPVSPPSGPIKNRNGNGVTHSLVRDLALRKKPLQGYALRLDGSRWTGPYLMDNYQQTNAVTVYDLSPKSGWDKLWSRLVQLDLLTLPDSSMLNGERRLFDGVSYVVEINRDGGYRTCQYGNPQEQTWPEAKEIISMAQTLHDEFSIK